MPWNGSGSYNLPPVYSPEVNGTVIDAVRWNGVTNDVAAGISNALAKDGQNTPTANLIMGGFKHTGAGEGAALGQYITFNQTTPIGQLTINTMAGAAIVIAASTVTWSGNPTHSGDHTFSGTISGVGSGLTALNASNLSSGSVPLARLTLLTDKLADTTSASNGAGMVAYAISQAYASGTVGRQVTTLLNARHRHLFDYLPSQAVIDAVIAGTNTTDLSPYIQDMLDDSVSQGGVTEFYPSLLKCGSALTHLLTAAPQTQLYREFLFHGGRLDFRASGIASGNFVTVGAVSSSFRTEAASQVVRGMRIIGTESDAGNNKTDFSWMNTPTTTTRGIRIQYGNKWSFYDCDVDLCYIGRETFSTWDDCFWQWQSRRCFIGEWRLDTCTVGAEYNSSFQYCAFCQVFKPSDTVTTGDGVRTYTNPRWEQSHVGTVLDPGNSSGGGAATDVTIIGVAWHNMYIEAMTYDLFRVGIEFDDDPSVRGSDQDKIIMNLDVSVFKLNHTFTSTAKMFVFPAAVDKVYGMRFYGPAHPVNDVVNPAHCKSKTWQMAHSKTNITNQPFEFTTSNSGFAVVDSDGTPPVILAQGGNIEALVDWPSALGGGGTLANGTYEFSVREGYWNGASLAGLFRYVISGNANNAQVQKDNSGATAPLFAGTRIRVLVKDYAGTLVNASRLAFTINGINGP